MQFNGTSVMERVVGSPVVAGPTWFEQTGQPFVLRMEHPLSFAEMVAALYDEAGIIIADDLATAEDVWGQVAVSLTARGLWTIQACAEAIERDEPLGKVKDTVWLAFCRERVNAVLAEGVAR